MSEIPRAFTDYARRVSSGIDSAAERRDTTEEILTHLMDAYAEELAEGATEQEAERAVLERMGAAAEFVRPLEKAHTPRLSKTTLAVILGAGLLVLLAIWASLFFYVLQATG